MNPPLLYENNKIIYLLGDREQLDRRFFYIIVGMGWRSLGYTP